jgi:hypothetical protein
MFLVIDCNGSLTETVYRTMDAEAGTTGWAVPR